MNFICDSYFDYNFLPFIWQRLNGTVKEVFGFSEN